MSKIITKWIADDAVDKTKIAADIAGLGLSQAVGGELDVNVDGSTIEISTDTLQVKDLGIGTTKLTGTSVTAAKLGNDVAGNGLTGGNGSALAASADSTGGTNLATSINVSTNGIAIKIDDDTIKTNNSSQLYVKGNSIGPSEVDETASYTWITGSHDFTGTSSISVPTPTQDAHAATKGYVDAKVEGLEPKGSVQALADSNQTLSGLPTNIDGVTSWSANDLILLTGQTDASENGIWKVQATAWTRPDNFAAGADGSSAWIIVDQGATYQDQFWVCTTNKGSAVIDTDNLAWQFNGGLTNVTAGTGLTKSGNTVHIGNGSTGNVNGINRTADDIAAAVDNTTIEIASNLLQIKDLGVSAAKLAGTSVTAAKLGSDVAGNGLTGGNGSAIAAAVDSTGGANLAKVINVSSNGIAVKIDDSTIGENGSNRLYVKSAGITETQLAASVAGNGLAGGNGTALSLDINDIAAAETSADNADLIAIYDNSAAGLRKMTRANFLAGVGGGGTLYQEAHVITSGESTTGYFTLGNSPSSAAEVTCFVNGGPPQINKQAVGATGASPDFDILSSNQFHFNNNGAATGLTEHLGTDDIVFVLYSY